MIKQILTGTLALCLLLTLSGCDEDDTEEAVVSSGTESTMVVEYGSYGENNIFGTSETIRIIWTKNTTLNSSLNLTSNVDTSTDAYLSSEFGTPHFNYDIDNATEAGVYTIVCEPIFSSGDWIRYSCLRDGMLASQQNTDIDNGFVIDYTIMNRVFDTNPENTGSVTLGFITYSNI
jgi:hypothetical protein